VPGTGSNQAAYTIVILFLASSTTYFFRFYFNVPSLPSTTADIAALGSAVSVRLTSSGHIQLWTGSQVGSDSAATIAANTWYRVELQLIVDSSNRYTGGELRLDGTTVATASGSLVDVTGIQLTVGWTGAASLPGANQVVYLDDWALNNTAGAANNSWPGDGKVVILLPTADSAVGTGWTLGTGTAISANSGSTAVKNVPPLGVADLAAGSDPKQIRNAASAANSNYDATMTTYTAAGVPAGATVNAVGPWVATAAPVATTPKTGTVGVVSNPVITNISLGTLAFVGGFWEGHAAAAYPTGWKWSPGTIANAPTVTLGTAPVMRVTQVTASTLIAMVCFMAIYVDYTPAAAAAAAIPDVGMALTVT
jgi:hypothetical protein